MCLVKDKKNGCKQPTFNMYTLKNIYNNCTFEPKRILKFGSPNWREGRLFLALTFNLLSTKNMKQGSTWIGTLMRRIAIDKNRPPILGRRWCHYSHCQHGGPHHEASGLYTDTSHSRSVPLSQNVWPWQAPKTTQPALRDSWPTFPGHNCTML